MLVELPGPCVLLAAASRFLSFQNLVLETKILPKTIFWEPLQRDNDTAIIVTSIKLIMLPFVTLLSQMAPVIRRPGFAHDTGFPSDSLSKEFVNSPGKLQRRPYGISRFPSSANWSD